MIVISNSKIKTSRVKNAILLFLVFISFKLLSQSDFRKGSIINLNGDTLSGELDYQGNAENGRLIRFKSGDAESVYTPFQIKSYSFEKGKSYASKIAIIGNDTLEIFAEYLVKGKKDLYLCKTESGFHYLINGADSVLLELAYKQEIVNEKGINYHKENKQFVGALKFYFNDCPELFPEIEKLKSPQRKSLISITKEYHDITCGEESCVVFNRKEYPFQIAVEPVVRFYLKNGFFDDTIFNAYGANLYVWLPNSSERLFFKTGTNFSKTSTNDLVQIPLQLEYVFPYKHIKPKFNFGVNMLFLYNAQSFEGGTVTALAGTGFYLKMTNWIYLDFNIESDLFALGNKAQLFNTFSTTFGLYFKIGKKYH